MVIVISRTRFTRCPISDVARNALAALRGRGAERTRRTRLTRRAWIPVHIHLTHCDVTLAAGLRSLRCVRASGAVLTCSRGVRICVGLALSARNALRLALGHLLMADRTLHARRRWAAIEVCVSCSARGALGRASWCVSTGRALSPIRITRRRRVSIMVNVPLGTCCANSRLRSRIRAYGAGFAGR